MAYHSAKFQLVFALPRRLGGPKRMLEMVSKYNKLAPNS